MKKFAKTANVIKTIKLHRELEKLKLSMVRKRIHELVSKEQFDKADKLFEEYTLLECLFKLNEECRKPISKDKRKEKVIMF